MNRKKEDKNRTRNIKMIQSTVAFLSLVLVSGLNTAAEFQANPPKYSYNLRKRKKRRGSSIQEEPTVSYGHTNKRKRRQWPPPGQVYQTKDERCNDEDLLKSDENINGIQSAAPGTSAGQTPITSEESQWLPSWEALDEFKHDHNSSILSENVLHCDNTHDDGPNMSKASTSFSKPKGRPKGKKNKTSFGRKLPDAQRKKNSWDALTPDQQRLQLDKKAQQKMELRDNETPEQRRERLDLDKESHKQARVSESAEAYEERNRKKSECYKKQKGKLKPELKGLAIKKDLDNQDKFCGLSEEAIAVTKDNEKQAYGLKNGRKCHFCHAYLLPSEHDGFCCNNGHIKLPLSDPPAMLKEKLKNDPNFKDEIRSYNNSLAMASLGFDELVRSSRWNPTLKFGGKMYHQIGPLRTSDGKPRSFAQMYVNDPSIDAEAEAERRIQSVTMERTEHKIDKKTMLELQAMIHEHNPYAASFKALADIPEDQVKDVKFVLKKDKRRQTDEHKGRYNLPTSCNEIALIALNDVNDPADVRIQLKDGPNKFISDLNQHFDPLHYVLLFPDGRPGWCVELYQTDPETGGVRKNKSGQPMKISPTMFYNYQLQTRDEQFHFNTIPRSGKLMQEYACMQFYKAERQRLNYIKNNQAQIKAAKYKEFKDALHQNDNMENIGERIILPGTHYCSPRWYQNCFQDGMALVRSFGKPHLFLTFTANAKWPEIEASLEKNEKSYDRPDVVNRIFFMKLKELMDDIRNSEILGRNKGYVSMIEFQKRGLPHCHMMLWLDEKDAPKTAEDYDKFTCAEFPHATDQKELHNLVKNLMVHGPCTGINEDSPCFNKKSKSCEKNYPKQLNRFSLHSDSNYPVYRRRAPQDGGHTAEVYVSKLGTTKTLDNQWVVPYNPTLLMKFNAHINVEVVASVVGIKYLFKYVSKGTDRIMVENQGEKTPANNEVQNFINARYIGATEALWRLFGYPMHGMYPEVTKLQIHLPEGHTAFMKIHDERNMNETEKNKLRQEQMEALRKQEKTMLTAFFDLNVDDEKAREHMYCDILKYYRFDAKEKKYFKRNNKTDPNIDGTDGQRSNMVGRIPVIGLNVHQKELFFLRMLLYNVKGPKSYEDLRTVNGKVCYSFQEACIKLGLFEDDLEIEKCLTEAATVKFPKQFRQLFVTLMTQAIASNPRDLFEKFKTELSEDFMKEAKLKSLVENDPKSEQIINATLIELSHLFEAAGKSLTDLGLPEPVNMPNNILPREIRDEIYENVDELQEQTNNAMSKLNTEQQIVFDAVKEAIDGGHGGVFHIDAPGGTGKTFVLTTLLSYVRAQKKIGFAMATSGIAATLLPGGRTVHNRLKVPIKIDDTTKLAIKSCDDTQCTDDCRKCGPMAKLIRKTDLMIIDEVTMGSKLMFEAIDKSLKKIRHQPNKPFGGVTLVLSGDWRQCLPVVPKGTRAQIIHDTLKYSTLWSEIKTFHLTENMRIKYGADGCDPEFEQYLLRIGEGREEIIDEEGDMMIKIPDFLKSKAKTVHEFCQSIFPDLNKNIQEGLKRIGMKDRGCFDWLMSRAIICPTNADAEEINQIMMKQFKGNLMVYRSADKVVDPNEATKYPQEFLNSVSLSSLPPHILELKPGTPIMLLRNMDPANGHVNGARYFVKELKSSVIIAELAIGPYKGNQLMIPRIPFKPEDKTLPFEFTRKQFPVKVCFAITSNKSQGQTLDKVGIYLKNQFFSHGQLYVAMSRVRSSKALNIFLPPVDPKKLDRKGKNSGSLKIPTSSGDYMRNVVYPESLS